jgi:hypothetical protein
VIDFKYPVTQGVAPLGVYEIERTDYPLINSATGETYKQGFPWASKSGTELQIPQGGCGPMDHETRKGPRK